MINWRSGKGGFVGGLKTSITGFFSSSYATQEEGVRITETLESLDLSEFSPSISLTGTLNLEEQTAQLLFVGRNPAAGQQGFNNQFQGFLKDFDFAAGYVKTSEFSGTIKQSPIYTGYIKTTTFTGVIN